MLKWFKKKGVDKPDVPSEVHQVLMHSFGQVRRDVHNVYEWLKFLHSQNQGQQKIIQDLQQQIMFMPKNKEEIKELIDNHYSLDPVLDKIKEIEARVSHISQKNKESEPSAHETLTRSQSEMLGKLHEISSKIGSLSRVYHAPQPVHHIAQKPTSKSNLHDKIIRNVTRNSKEYIKNILLKTIIKYEKISGLQLREIIVEEQGLVSRSSFYRLLLELEAERKLTVTPEGKEKIYIAVNSEIVTV